MAEHITTEGLLDLFAVARKLRDAARQEPDDGYAGLYERAAAALEERGWQLAVRPFGVVTNVPPEPDLDVNRRVHRLRGASRR